MHYLQLFFQDRSEPILVPVEEAEGRNIVDHLRERTEPLHFMEFTSIVRHDIWMNGARLQMAQFLLEMDTPPFARDAIRPSRQFPKEEAEEADLVNVLWQVRFWLQGRREPLLVSDLSGHDWVEI